MFEKLFQKYPEGYTFRPEIQGSLAGQCAWFVQQITDCPKVGSPLAEKKKNLEKLVKAGRAFYPGDGVPLAGYTVITSENPTWGHVYVIREKTPISYKITESNYAKPLRVSHSRSVSHMNPKILGFIKTSFKPDLIGSDGQPKEEDVNTPSPWAVEAWEWSQEKKYITGGFPHRAVSREEMAVILKRFHDTQLQK